jgi:hypothetical protein
MNEASTPYLWSSDVDQWSSDVDWWSSGVTEVVSLVTGVCREIGDTRGRGGHRAGRIPDLVDTVTAGRARPMRPRLAERQPGEPARSDQAHHGARRHELAQRDRAGQHAEEHVGVLLAARDRPEERHLGRGGRVDRGQPGGEVIHRPGGAIPGAMVTGERLSQRADTAEPVGDGIGQQFRVAEGVADALAGDRVEQQAGVTDQGPAGTVGLAQDRGGLVR